MTAEQVSLVQQSFGKILPIADAAAALFYDQLFRTDPALRSLFRGDITQQGQKLMQALAFVVKGLQEPAGILPTVQALGKRHRSYGVKAADYQTVGAVLLWTLEQGLGEAFTPAVKDAWATAYSLLASTMQEAAEAA